MMKTLSGQTVSYTYTTGDSYRVSVADGKAIWLVLTGANAGETREEVADFAEVAPDVWFVTWLEPTQEVVSLVLNLAARSVHCSYYGEGERYFWQGNITDIGPTEQATKG